MHLSLRTTDPWLGIQPSDDESERNEDLPPAALPRWQLLPVIGGPPAGRSDQASAGQPFDGAGTLRGHPQPLEASSLPFQCGRESRQFQRLEAARLLMIWPVAAAADQLAIAGADLATTVLAEGRRSRLVERLREDLQIVETIDMDVTTLEQGSLVMLEACCPEEHLEMVEQEVHRQLQRTLSEPVTAEEFDRPCNWWAMAIASASKRRELWLPVSVRKCCGVGTGICWHPLRIWRSGMLHRSARVMPPSNAQNAFTLIARPEEIA